MHPLALLHSAVTHSHELKAWSYIVLALLVLLEGPVATLTAAVAAAVGLLNVWLVFGCCCIGNLTADVLWYELGRHGHDEWLVTHGKWLGLTRERVVNLERRMRANSYRIIFVAKITLFFSVPALLAAGVSKVRFSRWLPIDVLGEFMWTGTLVVVGFYFAGAVQHLERGLQIAATAAFVVFIPVLFYLIRRFGTSWSERAD